MLNGNFQFDCGKGEKLRHLNECTQLMSSCASSFLFVYNILLESSLDEHITEQIIKSIKSFVYMTSLLDMCGEREAFVTALCKAALPAAYAHTVLNFKLLTDLSPNSAATHASSSSSSSRTSSPSASATSTSNSSSSKHQQQQQQQYMQQDDSSERQIQVVAIGPALNSSAATSTIFITAKNLLTVKSLLTMAQTYAELLGSSWYTVLNTIQHMAWSLGLKPTAGSSGQLKSSSSSLVASTSASAASVGASSSGGIVSSTSAASSASPSANNTSALNASGLSSSSSSAANGPNSASMSNGGSGSTAVGDSTSSSAAVPMITTAIQTEIAFICTMLSKVFELTCVASDEALEHVVNALLRMSLECGDAVATTTATTTSGTSSTATTPRTAGVALGGGVSGSGSGSAANAEPCLFAVAKLYETTISNVSRLELFWPQLTAHMLAACRHTNVRYREWYVDSLCHMIKATFNYYQQQQTTQTSSTNNATTTA